MKVEVDMHTHSYFSDGFDTPKQIVEQAKKKGLKAICLSDHDTIIGSKIFQEEAEKNSLETLVSMEVSTVYYDSQINILAYCLSLEHVELINRKLQAHIIMRNEQFAKMYKVLKNAGILKVDLNEFLSCFPKDSAGFNTLAFKYVLADYLDCHYDDLDSEKYIMNLINIPTDKIKLHAPHEVIRFIKRLGGVSILAHPYTISVNGETRLKDLVELIEELKAEGLDGIEAYHPDHNRNQSKRLVNIAREFDLLISGGSDYHGFFKKNRYLG